MVKLRLVKTTISCSTSGIERKFNSETRGKIFVSKIFWRQDQEKSSAPETLGAN